MTRGDVMQANTTRVPVPFKPIDSLCNILYGSAFNAALFNSKGDGLPVVRIRDVNSGFSGTYYSGAYDHRYVVENGDILIGMDGDFRAVRWTHGRALLNQRVCRLESFKAEVLPEFILLKVQDELDRIHRTTQGSTVKHLSARDLRSARVPVPSLEVQREVVKTLHHFADLQVRLEAELQAELKARLFQYSHYRESLIALVDGVRVQALPMGEIGQFIRGRRFTRRDVVPEGVPSIHYGEIYTQYGTSARKAVSFVRRDMADELRYARPGDVVIAAVGETVEDLGKGVAWLGDSPVAIHDDTFLFRSDLNPTYVAHFLRTRDFESQKYRHVAQGKVKRLAAGGLAQIRIPCPPRSDQDRIAQVLDQFGTLVNDLSVELSAEVRARRQQYEYYRDQLLTFPEAAA